MAKLPRWVPIAGGVAVLLVFAVLGLAVVGGSWMREHVSVSEAPSDEAAAQTLATARARFAGQTPLLELDARGTPRRVVNAATRGKSGTVETVHVLAWSPTRHRLARADIPFWLIRLKPGRFHIRAHAGGVDDGGLTLDAADIERFGPGLLLDADTSGGQHVLVWTQ